MNKIVISLLMLIAGSVIAQTSKTPINNGVLQSDLDAAGYKILSANLSDYAGANMTWNVATNKFDATGGGGGTPGGSTTQFQYNNAGAFGGTANLIFSSGQVKAVDGNFVLTNIIDATKQVNFSVTNVPTGTTESIIVPNAANPVIVKPDIGATDNFLTGIGAAGIITKAQPAFSNLSGNIVHTQMNSGTGASSTTFWRGNDTWATPAGTTTTGTGFWHNTTGALDGASRAVDLSTADVTGNLGHTHLNSGTSASSTTFWRGDDTWATPAAGTPGGSNTQVQFNDSSAFGGDADFTWNKTTNVLALGTAVTTGSITLDNAGLVGLRNASGNLILQSSSADAARVNPAYFEIPAACVFGWSSTSDPVGVGFDTAFARNAAGIVEINNGTPGSYRDILARGLRSNAVAFASAIAAPVEGTQQAFTDSSTNVSGATITGGGSNHVLGYYNGTNWVVDSGVGGAGVTSIATTSPITGGTITTTGTLGLNVGVDHAFTAAQSVTTSDSATNTVVDELTLTHNSNGVIAANFGTGLLFNAQDSTTANVNIAEIQALWTTPTHSSNASNLVFKLDNGTTTPATAVTFKPPGVVDVVTGFRIGGAAAAGKMLRGTGTNFSASTETWPSTNTAGYKVTGDGTNYVAYPTDLVASSTATVSAGYSADTYLAGSAVTVAAGDFKAQGQYHCVFDMTKTAACTSTPIISVRVGTAGTTADTAVCTLTFSAGTAAADSGMFEVYVNFRSVGSGTSAVFQAVGSVQHQGGVTGLVSKNSDYAASTSSGFASNTPTKIGLSFNGGSTGAAFSGTNLIVQTQMVQP